MTTKDKFVIVPLAIVQDRQLTHRQRVVLEALISFRSARTGKVFSDLEGIAERCGLHPKVVSASTNELARAGRIAIKRNRRGCNDYHFLFDFHDWQYKPSEAPEWARQGGQPQDFPETATSKILDVTESATSSFLDVTESGPRGNGIRDQEVTESVTPLQTTTTDQLETISPLPPSGGRDAPEREEQAEAAKTFTLTPETGAPKATKPKKAKRGAMTPEVAERFAAFWRSYPKKVGKPEAAKAFAKVAPDAEQLVSMLAAVEAQHRAYRADPKRWRADGKLDKSYIPNASTWLNQQRWDDEVEDAPEVEQPNAAAVLEAWAEAFPADPAQPVAAFRLTASARDLHAHWNAHRNHKDPNFWAALFEVARTDPALQEHRSRGRMTLAWALSERGFSQLLTALISRQSRARMEARNAA